MKIKSNVWEWREALATVDDCKGQLTRMGWEVTSINEDKYTITLERKHNPLETLDDIKALLAEMESL